mmetsp:Transcript_25134/g.55309  ORF Transcript_25134/g.55309 Transcript_25134/m.55309 type:complete len:206 (+) Transcript_25134:3-620(+)
MVQDSRIVSCLLLVVYFAYLFFSIYTHSYLFQSEGGEEEEIPDMGPWLAASLLFVFTIITSYCTEFLVDAIDGTIDSWHLSQEFIGIILLPIIGNAVEHYTAITVAAKNKMDLSLGVAAGSGCQMALLVTPFTVLAGWYMDKPMSLDFHPFQVIVLTFSVLVVGSCLQHGTSNWLEGVMLIVAYTMVALVYFFQDDSPDGSLLIG